MRNFSQNLAYWRHVRGMTQEQLASRLHMTPQAVSKWEKGSYPDGSLLPELSRILGVSLDVLFGLKDEDENYDTARNAMEEVCRYSEEERGKRFMEICYHMLYGFHPNPKMEQINFPEKLTKETFAHLRTDHEIAIARLNQDQQYLCFLRIPENGVNAYTQITPRLTKLFQLLSDADALKIMFHCETLERNYVFSKESLSEKLNIPFDRVSEIVDQLLWFGIIWQLTADIGGKGDTFPVYCYTHTVPLTAILTLATSITHFIINCEPNIDIWEHGPFRKEKENPKSNNI